MTDNLPDARELNILMISLGDEVLTGWADTRERHLDYAERVGHLYIVGYSPKSRDLHQTAVSDRLTMYPTRSVSRATFVWDAYQIGTKICREQHIDMITTQDPFTTGLVGVLLKWRFKLPLLVQNHSDFFDNKYWLAEKPLYRLLHTVGKWVIKRAEMHRVVNATEQAKYMRMGIPAERIKVIGTLTMLDSYTPQSPAGESEVLRQRFGIPADAPILAWAGNPVWFKRIPLLLDAFAIVNSKYPNTHLLLVGDFSARPDVLDQIERLGLTQKVHFAGKASHEELPSYYRLCDVYLHSSIYEGLGRVMVEAAACGKPIVAVHSAGAHEIVIDGETGLLCESENAADMAAKIGLLLDNPAWAKSMGLAGREAALAKFEYKNRVKVLIDLWRETARFGKRQTVKSAEPIRTPR